MLTECGGEATDAGQRIMLHRGLWSAAVLHVAGWRGPRASIVPTIPSATLQHCNDLVIDSWRIAVRHFRYGQSRPPWRLHT